MITPVQERIPIYLAAIGPKNTALAGEIADGWMPTFFSPEHVDQLRALLQEGADRAGRSLDGFDMAPTVQVYVSDDREAARDLMRPILALYIGGMGSRKQNFYNQLVQRYGFEAAAAEIQDLYLDGKKDRGGRGDPRRADRHGLAVRAARRRRRADRRLPRRRRRDADREPDGLHRGGPDRRSCARSPSSRLEPAAARSSSGAFGQPGSRLPDARARRASSSRAGTRSPTRPGSAGATRSRRPGCSSCPRPSTRCSRPASEPIEALRGGRAGHRAHPAGGRAGTARRRRPRHPHARARAGR